MKIYGLIGNPLGHSFSQKYFTNKFKAENINDCIYRNFEIKDLSSEIPELKANKSVYGLNVTIPYKQDILQYFDEASDVCKEINACNCIKITNGKWIGFNTDVIGFKKTFVPNLKSYHCKALILGTGGSSKAVAYVLKKLGIDFLFVSRKKIEKGSVIDYDSITPSLLREYTIVINTTPAGMFPHIDSFPEIPYDAIFENHYFFDLIYNPSQTLFLSKAQLQGATICNGEKMLTIQADESWKIWTQ